MRHLLYLHGLGSSPESTKAQALATRLAGRGLTLHCPDLNFPDFSTLTTTRMIDRVAATIGGLPRAPTVLIGSSLGAFVALHLADRIGTIDLTLPPIDQLVLLAPALDFCGSALDTVFGPGTVDRWRESGWLEMAHHSAGEMRRVHYELYADAARYDSFATTIETPTLILQGARDAIVDPAMVERFAADRPHVRLVMLDDDHQLTVSIDRIWLELSAFLGLVDDG